MGSLLAGRRRRVAAAPTGAPVGAPVAVPVRWPAALALAAVAAVGAVAFVWPFLVPADMALAHGQDAPWFFAVLLGLLAVVLLAELTAGRLDAKTITVLAVVASAGGAMRVLSAGTAGLEPMFFVVILAGRVLGRGAGFLGGALAVLTGAFLTGGVGPWLPFQMVAAGWVGLLAGSLPRLGARAERWLLVGFALVTGLAYGAVMNLWFWPFLGAGAPVGAGFVPDGGLTVNLANYGRFYLLTSLAWDLPRGVLNAVLVALAGPATLRVLRRAVRRAAFDAPVAFEPAVSPEPRVESGAESMR